MAEVLPRRSGCVDPLSPLFLPMTSNSVRAGYHGAGMDEATSVRLSLDCFAPGSCNEDSSGWSMPATSS